MSKIVLFDIDETILTTFPFLNPDSSKIMFEKVFGLKDTHEGLIYNFGKTEETIIKEVLQTVGYNKPVSPQTLQEAYKVWAQAAEDALKITPATLLPGIKELLTELAKKPEIKIGLFTGNSYWRAETKINSAKLEEFFVESGGKLKGAFGNEASDRIELLKIAKNRLGTTVDKVLFIDDSIFGAKMAKENNVTAILVATGHVPLEELSKYSNTVFPNFDDNRWQKAIEIIEKV